MLGSIPNPKKTFQIPRKAEDVKTALEHLYLYTSKYKFTKSTPAFNQYTFEASEFLSLGVYVDINYSQAGDKTDITIEVRRKIGSFDKSHEVGLANDHIQKITDLIAVSMESDHALRLSEVRQEQEIKKKAEDDRLAAIEANRLKEEEFKKNSPFLYYSKWVLMWGALIGVIIGMLYLMTLI